MSTGPVKASTASGQNLTAEHDDILDDLFHGCAFHAFLDQAEEEGGWPSVEGTRRRAYAYYEEELAKKNAAKPAGEGRPATTSSPRPVSASDPDSHDGHHAYDEA
jgi:hypothetical protein